MRPLRLGGVRRALVVAPHPDDEAIGAFGLIARLRQAGARVTVLIVSDGAGSHRASATWPRRRLVAARARESRRAMRRCGLSARDLVFLGLPDGALHRSPPRAAAGVRRVASAARADLIVGPSARDDHPDHRAVARMLARASGSARRLAYLVWPGRRPRGRGAATGLPLGPLRATKRAAIRGYATQMGLIADDPAGFAIARHELAGFTRPMETFMRDRR